MRIRVWKQIYTTPFVRLNLQTKGFSLSFGHRGIGCVTIGRRGIRETLDTPMPGVYVSEEQRWDELKNGLQERDR
jgi:hypothetical protein